MSVNKPKQENQKAGSKQRSPKPASEKIPLPALQQTDLDVIIQRARQDPHLLTPQAVQLLQRTIGNRAVGQLLTPTLSPSTIQESKRRMDLSPNPKTDVVQRVGVANGAFEDPTPTDVYDIPLFWIARIVNYFEGQQGTMSFGSRIQIKAGLSNAPQATRYFSFSEAEYKEMKRRLKALDPEERRRKAEDAKERGDYNTDLNPEAKTQNCGYCVIAYFCGHETADEAKEDTDFMELEGLLHPDHTAFVQLRGKIEEVSRVGPIVDVDSKDNLRVAVVQAVPNADDVAWFALWLPNHFVVLVVENDGDNIKLEITDEQTSETYDFDWLSDTNFSYFRVFDGPK